MWYRYGYFRWHMNTFFIKNFFSYYSMQNNTSFCYVLHYILRNGAITLILVCKHMFFCEQVITIKSVIQVHRLSITDQIDHDKRGRNYKNKNVLHDKADRQILIPLYYKQNGRVQNPIPNNTNTAQTNIFFYIARIADSILL